MSNSIADSGFKALWFRTVVFQLVGMLMALSSSTMALDLDKMALTSLCMVLSHNFKWEQTAIAIILKGLMSQLTLLCCEQPELINEHYNVSTKSANQTIVVFSCLIISVAQCFMRRRSLSLEFQSPTLLINTFIRAALLTTVQDCYVFLSVCSYFFCPYILQFMITNEIVRLCQSD